MSWSEIIIISLVEGITEFLPVSSTGHMIVVSHLIGSVQDDILQGFEVVIQIGAIGAVALYYRRTLRQGMALWIRIAIAFVPIGTVGLLCAPYIKELFQPVIVAVAFIFGGIVLIAVERIWGATDANHGTDLHSLTYRQSLSIGVAQIFALIPGTSRSGATIVGGLIGGLSRKSATEFSFLVAVPVMCATTLFDIVSLRNVLHGEVLWQFAVGILISFFVAYVSIVALLSFVSRFRFIGFGYYRIVIGLLILCFWV